MSADEKREGKKRPLFLYIFLSIFVIVGSACLVYAPVKIVKTLAFIRTAASTTGTVEGYKASRNSKGTTYAPQVSFNTFVGTSVRFHSQISGSSSAYVIGEQVPVYYDPQHPEHAEINGFVPLWMPVIIFLTIGVSFTAAGGGMIFALRRGVLQMRQRDAALRQGMKDWESDPSWRSGVAPSATRNEMWFFWLFALAWNAIALPTGYLCLNAVINEGNTPAALGLLFPLFGFWLLTQALLKTLHLAKFGDILLRLDPAPGSLGGEVGGVIDLNLPFRAEQVFMVSLSCQRLVRHSKGTTEEPIWQDSGRAFAARERVGTKVAFRFAVPAHLPPTSSGPGENHRWVVALTAELPGIDLDSSFTVPVLATPSPVASTLSVPLAPATAPSPIPESIVRIDRHPEHLSLLYSPRRYLRIAFASCGAGGWFILLPVLMIYKAPAIGIVAFPFLLLGVVIVFCGLSLFGYSLEVVADAAQLTARRRFFALPVTTKVVPLSSVRNFEAVRAATQETGTKAQIYFYIVAHLRDGDKITVGDGIAGRANAEAIARIMADRFSVGSEANLAANS